MKIILDIDNKLLAALIKAEPAAINNNLDLEETIIRTLKHNLKELGYLQ